MTKNRTPTPVYLDPGMHSGLEVKGLMAVDIGIQMKRNDYVIYDEFKLKKNLSERYIKSMLI